MLLGIFMKKLTLFLLLVSCGLQVVAKGPLKTIGNIVFTPLVGVGTSHSHTKTHKKKHKLSVAPTAAPVVAPTVAQVVPATISENMTPVAQVVTPTVTQLVPDMISENIAIEVDPELVAAYEQMMICTPTAGDMLESVTPAATEVPAVVSIGVKEKATQWIKNAWSQVPSMQMMQTNCINAADEAFFYANKHRTMIAATVAAAAVIGGGYYWYKKSNVAKKQQN